MKCPKCGKNVSNGKKHCPYCGYALKEGLLLDDDCPEDELDAELVKREEFTFEEKTPSFAERELMAEKGISNIDELRVDDRFSYFGNGARYNDTSRFNLGAASSQFAGTQPAKMPKPTAAQTYSAKPISNKEKKKAVAGVAKVNRDKPQKKNKGCLIFIFIIVIIISAISEFAEEEDLGMIFDNVKNTVSTYVSKAISYFDDSNNEDETEFVFALNDLSTAINSNDLTALLSLENNYKDMDSETFDVTVKNIESLGENYAKSFIDGYVGQMLYNNNFYDDEYSVSDRSKVEFSFESARKDTIVFSMDIYLKDGTQHSFCGFLVNYEMENDRIYFDVV